jgi:hypothetical protein
MIWNGWEEKKLYTFICRECGRTGGYYDSGINNNNPLYIEAHKYDIHAKCWEAIDGFKKLMMVKKNGRWKK